jgi:hypothetical protein
LQPCNAQSPSYKPALMQREGREKKALIDTEFGVRL